MLVIQLTKNRTSLFLITPLVWTFWFQYTSNLLIMIFLWPFQASSQPQLLFHHVIYFLIQNVLEMLNFHTTEYNLILNKKFAQTSTQKQLGLMEVNFMVPMKKLQKVLELLTVVNWKQAKEIYFQKMPKEISFPVIQESTKTLPWPHYTQPLSGNTIDNATLFWRKTPS